MRSSGFSGTKRDNAVLSLVEMPGRMSSFPARRLAHGDARDAAAVHRLDRKFADACGGIKFRVNGAGTQAADGDMAAGGAQFLVNRFAQANHIVFGMHNR